MSNANIRVNTFMLLCEMIFTLLYAERVHIDWWKQMCASSVPPDSHFYANVFKLPSEQKCNTDNTFNTY